MNYPERRYVFPALAALVLSAVLMALYAGPPEVAGVSPPVPTSPLCAYCGVVRAECLGVEVCECDSPGCPTYYYQFDRYCDGCGDRIRR